MKKILTTCLLAFSMLSAMAQMTIWTSYPTSYTLDSGKTYVDTVISYVAYQYDYDEVDSITFVPYFYEATPKVDYPGYGYVTIVIQIPEGSECNGIAFKGTTDGSVWSGMNEYIGEEGSVSVDECIRFEKIEGTNTWFKATYKLGITGLEGKICLIYTDDSSWQGQARTWSIIKASSQAETSWDGNLVLRSSGVVYVKIDEWNKSECNLHIVPRSITLTIPDSECGREIPTIVGSFNGWNETGSPMTWNGGNVYTITVEAEDSDEFKFASSVSGWDNIIYVNDGEGQFSENPNIRFGTQTVFVLDYSDGKWSACNE